MIKRLHAHPVGNLALSVVIAATLLASIIACLPNLH
ncbi:putative membrane protein [Burkholderia cepacia]|jgi:hypothetical protein|uniref:Hypothetical phage protein n=1 Tax=Burkholderia cenocepacia (strain ATCC BAA-245 / DSM 16553 / LMG 16656 / NCTC 13227 / J2315 / CF5610) TaxID=216591 RepID=B4EME2_BURCJ|nr:putative membrane protein [Burkholderia cepacia]QNN07682.1 hypothetical protein K562_21915 [Burkholderia cenocepacia]CAR55738.1 hypothetical phage protein [Burkholderia cenocepacia J2315]SPV13106.1 Uncharacterised protein [Burkholderia cenocepacia]SPV15090.1 Uncharacterised protein [Burkholderia cenocepacia]